MPLTKEAYYYRLLFESHFGKKNEKVIDSMWRHTFSKQQDPSARLLDVYKN